MKKITETDIESVFFFVILYCKIDECGGGGENNGAVSLSNSDVMSPSNYDVVSLSNYDVVSLSNYDKVKSKICNFVL